jgi:hypothetical protein
MENALVSKGPTLWPITGDVEILAPIVLLNGSKSNSSLKLSKIVAIRRDALNDDRHDGGDGTEIGVLDSLVGKQDSP